MSADDGSVDDVCFVVVSDALNGDDVIVVANHVWDADEGRAECGELGGYGGGEVACVDGGDEAVGEAGECVLRAGQQRVVGAA